MASVNWRWWKGEADEDLCGQPSQPAGAAWVNVFGATIEHACNDLLAEVFRHMHVMPRMVFEITETSQILDREMLGPFLAALRLLGARAALDDYGTGFFDPLPGLKSEDSHSVTQNSFPACAGTLARDSDCFCVRTAPTPSR